jgi:hypothetical protein
MGMFSKLKNFMVSDDSSQLKNAPATTEGRNGETVNADYTVQADKVIPLRLTTSGMSQEQLKTRRINLIESSKFGRPFHENFMLVLLRVWLVLAPPLFVVLTAGEVAYILTRLVPPNDRSGQTIIILGALFIELAMMFCTFGLAIKRRDLAEKRETVGFVSKREEVEVWGGTFIWLVFAAINIIGQCAFLMHIIQASGSKDMTILYVFVASRVVGFILGDASTAFFLAHVDNSRLKLIARSEREKAALYKDLAQAEGDRQLVEAKAENEMMLMQLDVDMKKEEADFIASLKRQMFNDILERRNALPAPSKSTVRRLDTGS